ncbi:MAG: LCP family protein [Spirochaetes bacterium]|nr:LCP family protein [Spirochaetota bacterium]
MRGKNKGIDRNLIFLSLIFVIIIFTVVFIFRQLRSDEFMIRMEKNDYIAISFNIGSGNSLLFSKLLIISPDTYRAAIFNIPANNRTLIGSLSRIERLDTLFDFKRPERMIRQIESLTNIPVDFYINIEPNNLIKIVDLLFGLELFVANPVEIINENEMILLPSGSNVLDGRKVLTFLTANSSNENNPELIGRWHKFLQAFIKKTAEESVFLANRDAFNRFYSLLSTDMNRKAFRSFISVLGNINTERVILQRVLGDRRTVDNQVLLFPYQDGNLLRETIERTLFLLKSEDAISGEEAIVRIEILNGTNIQGLAARTSHIFITHGFDVVSVGNAGRNNYERTVVIAQGTHVTSAGKVAAVIRCTNIEISDEPAITIAGEDNTIFSPANRADVTVILGRDFDGRFVR